MILFDLHWFVSRLEVQRCHLRSDIPHRNRIVVGGVDSLSFRVDPAQLDFVVPEKHLTELDLGQVGHHHLLGER